MKTTAIAVLSAIAAVGAFAQQQPPPARSDVQVSLTWDPVVYPGLTGYRLYWGDVSNQLYTGSTNLPATASSITITVPMAFDHRWVITAIAGGVESPPSVPATNVVLRPPGQMKIKSAVFTIEMTVPVEVEQSQ